MMTPPPLHVLLLPLLLPLLASPVSALPLFSWSTLPVYTHTCNATGPFNEAAITALARYPLVTVEKGQGVFETPTSGAGGAEARIAQALAAVKAANASAFTLFYYNSILSWDMYDLGAFLEANPSLCLQNRTGGCVRIPGDPAFPQPKNGLNVFDFTNPKVFSLWVDECVGLTSKYAGAVDGCFADRADNVTGQGWAHTLDPAKMEAYAEAHEQAMISVQAGLNASLPGSVLVSNHIVVPGVTATMIEAFAATEASISELLAFAATGAIVEVHPGYSEDGSDNYCEEITNSLAAFLIGAGEGSYYHCSRGWISNSSFPAADDEWLTWREEYDRPLGAPTGPAVKTGAVYTRGFASGTHVRFDTTTNTGTIRGGGGEVQKGDVAPRKGHEEGRAKGRATPASAPTSTRNNHQATPAMPRGIAKANLPSKICVVCHRPFTWRKLYERCWDEVQTCSDRCKGERKRKLREEKRREKNAEGWAAAQAQIALPPDPGASIVQMQ